MERYRIKHIRISVSMRAFQAKPLRRNGNLRQHRRGAASIFGPQTADCKEDGGGCQNGQQSWSSRSSPRAFQACGLSKHEGFPSKAPTACGLSRHEGFPSKAPTACGLSAQRHTKGYKEESLCIAQNYGLKTLYSIY